MNDQTAQYQAQQTNSYVDEYVPPAPGQDDTDSVGASAANQTTPSDSAGDNPAQDTASDDASLNLQEDIESQNIFFMLGVEDGDDDLKEKFLDQLQEVIWDDFLTNDIELLLTQNELGEFKTYKEKVDASEGDAQEQAKDEMVGYIEGLVPDLEDIMLEKALDLKADLFVERINGMKEYFAENQEKLAKVFEAEKQMYADQWKSAADVLNGIQE